MRRLMLAFVFISLFVFSFAESEKTQKEINLFIRVDDIFMLKTDIKPQELDNFLKVIEKHNGHAVLAAIPNRLLQKSNANGLMTDQLRDYVKRGHQIFQHGFDHKCPFTGNTGMEFYRPDGVQGYNQEQRIDKIREGKQILEAAIGKKVMGYVGPGSDYIYMKPDVPLLEKLGFVWLRDLDTSQTFVRNQIGYYTEGAEYTWGLRADNYDEMLEAAKKDFLEAMKTKSYWTIKFHDHFTRQQYGDGIIIKWLDDFLTWGDSLKNVKIKIITYDEYYKMKYPDFSDEF